MKGASIMPSPSDREAKLQALLAEARSIVQGFAALDEKLTWLEDTVHDKKAAHRPPWHDLFISVMWPALNDFYNISVYAVNNAISIVYTPAPIRR